LSGNEALPDSLIRALKKAHNIVILTGAGMSAESGIPTFREAQTGLWSKFDPMQLATPEAFAENPQRVWDWYCWRRELVQQAKPHEGYKALVQLEKLKPGLSIVTQNVDGLHQAAGSLRVIELHGNIMRTVCSVTRKPIPDEWIANHDTSPVPSPHCRGAYARPDVTWFGESLPAGALEQAQHSSRNARVLVSVGTSSMVQPAASLPWLAQEHGARLIEINPEPTPLSRTADCRLAMPASSGLALLLEACSGGEPDPDE
jgi:NAD-dependent deacetylase